MSDWRSWCSPADFVQVMASIALSMNLPYPPPCYFNFLTTVHKIPSPIYHFKYSLNTLPVLSPPPIFCYTSSTERIVPKVNHSYGSHSLC